MNCQSTQQCCDPVRAPSLHLGLTRQLPASAEAPAEARHALQRLAGAVHPDRLDDLRLMVTELVTNSFRHAPVEAGGLIELRLDVGPDALRVEVRDGGWGFTPPTAPELPDEGGLGLFLVDQMADRWGIRQDPSTCVWFEMEKPWQARNPRS